MTAPLGTIMILQGDTPPDDNYVKTPKLEDKKKREEN